MRFPIPSELEPYRVTSPSAGRYKSSRGMTSGIFVIPFKKVKLIVLFSSGSEWVDDGMPGEPWEHASISVSNESRIPSWEEMCHVKDLFWGDDEAVMQLHPPKVDYVNLHQHCLHLWKPTMSKIPLPPSICVGPKQ